MLRLAIFILNLTFTLPAAAASFDFLPAVSGAEQEFKSLMNQGNFKQALLTWPTAHQNTRFGDSPNGTALYSYLLLKNGLPYLAFDLLIDRTQPSNMNPDLVSLWEKEFKSSPLIQKGFIATRGGWRSIVNNEEIKVPVRNKKDIKAAFARVERTAEDAVNLRARILWQIATLAPSINEIDASLKALKMIRESKQSVIDEDQILMSLARVQYQRGDMEAALATYALIPKGSTLWVESVEERAWAHLRKDDYDKALGEATTLLSPALTPLVGPESYFLANLMALKICDYPRLLKNSELFKKRHRDHLILLQDLADKSLNKDLNAVLAKMDQKGVELEGIGALVSAIPRAALRDSKVSFFFNSRKQILAELARAQELSEYAKTLGESTLLAKAMGESKVKADQYRNQGIQRLRVLARTELKEYQNILNKLHVAEAEVIQRLHVDENLKGQRSSLTQAKESADVLVFPYNSDEVWLDELDNYKAQTKDCPTLKGAKL